MNDMSDRKSRRSVARGIVAFESVMWLTAILPLIVLGCVVAATVHDQNALRWIPESVLEGQRVHGIRMEGGLSGVEWAVNSDGLFENLPNVLDEAIQRARATLLNVSGASAHACVSVLIVDEGSGRVVSEEQRRCDSRGPLAGVLDMDRYLNRYLGRPVGIPLQTGSATSGFIGRLVVVGLSVGAEMGEVSRLLGKKYVEYGATAIPRQEVVL
jgi:hypothetical protein